MSLIKKPNLQQIFNNSPLGIRLAILFGRLLPPKAGYALARRVADWIASHRDWTIVHGARLNQWVISQKQLSGKDLDRAVVETFRSQARALYDFYHYCDTAPEEQKLIVFDGRVNEVIAQSQRLNSSQGCVVVGIHMSNFDFALRMAFRMGLRALLITLSELSGGYLQQYEMRRSAGMEIAPATLSTFRQAVSRLQAGGLVITGIDRPTPDSKYKPHFFGHPAPLPVHYIQLALQAHVPVILAALELQPDGIYRFLFSEPIEMRPHADRRREIIQNAETVLAVAETFIRRSPHQWAMFLPVWSDLMAEVP